MSEMSSGSIALVSFRLKISVKVYMQPYSLFVLYSMC